MRFNGIFCAARAALGTAYLLFPALPGRIAGTDHNARAARVTARILGARHLTQALATAGQPASAVLALGTEADAAHAASMAILGVVSRRWRRAALADALIAATLAAAGLAATARGDHNQPAAAGWQSLRDRYASRLAAALIPRQILPERLRSTGAVR